MSIQKSFNKTQGVAASAGTIQADLVTRLKFELAVLNFLKYIFSTINNSYCSSILVIAIKTRHSLNFNLL